MSKIYFFIILFSILIIACDDNNTTVVKNPLDISIKFLEVYDVSELKSFKVDVWKDKDSSGAFADFVESSKCITLPSSAKPQDRRVEFNLDDNEYLFTFYGSITENCLNPDWVGQSISTVNKEQQNYISILVSKKNSVSVSTLTLPALRGFFTAMFDKESNKIILAGGADFTYNRLNRLTENKCTHESTTPCVCFDETDDNCYKPIENSVCESLTNDSDFCTECLNVESNKFTAPEAYCTIPCQNSFDNICYLRATNDIIELDISDKSSNFLKTSANTPIKLLQPKIEGKFIKLLNKYYYLGGVPMVELNKETPYFHSIKYSGYNYNNVMWSNLKEQFVNIPSFDEKNILVDYNILLNGSQFIILGGSITGYINTESDFNSDLFECDDDSCTKNTTSSYNIGNNIGGLVYETSDSKIVVYGGITFPFTNDNSFIKENNGQIISGSEKSVKTYKQNLIKVGPDYYAVGGFDYTIINGKIEIGDYISTVNKINLTDLSSPVVYSNNLLENLIFPEYLESYGNGFLIVGGLYKNGDEVVPSNKIIYFNPTAAEAEQFTVLHTLNIGRFGHKVIKDNDGRIWIIGGMTSDGNQLVLTSSVEIITPEDFGRAPHQND